MDSAEDSPPQWQQLRSAGGRSHAGGQEQGRLHHLAEPLTRWVTMAEAQAADGTGDPAVLLILDLCHSGSVVTEHLRSLVRPERRRVWVIAACHSDQSAYDGRLSIAVGEILSGFASGALKLDPSMPYIPITRFCREVARHGVTEHVCGHGDIIAVPRPLKQRFPTVDLDLTDSIAPFDFHRAAHAAHTEISVWAACVQGWAGRGQSSSDASVSEIELMQYR
ncbi:hypothetical protein ACFYWS_14355 [Streptomyces sp. NPDC002795]|uniref:hypothetical protein n=1 Tax=Streptomyces sp. NPDC002795 TaxID=3364665 RepID=UPI0036C58079